MMENLLASMRTRSPIVPGAASPSATTDGRGGGGGVGYGAAAGGMNAIGSSFEVMSSNPGEKDFAEDDLHESQRTLTVQLRAMIRYMPVLKLAVLPLSVAVLAALWLAGDALSPDAAPSLQIAAFFCALLAVLPCGTWIVELLEDLVMRYESEKMGVVVNVVFEHFTSILFSLCALDWREHRSLCWIKPLLMGCVLFNLLVVLGGTILVSPDAEDRLGSSLGVSAWTTFGTGLVFSSAVLMIPTVYAVTITAPDVSLVVKKKKISPQAAMDIQNTKLLIISRALSLVVLLVYASYMVMVFHSNLNYYTSAGNPNSPSTLSYALQYRESLLRAQPGSIHAFTGPQLTAFVAVVSAAFLIGLDVVLCYVLVHTLPAVVANTPLPLPFFLVIILPAVFEGGALGAAMLMSRACRLDIAASISFSGIVHLFLCVLPSIVLVAWGLGAPLELAFHPFLACTCFIAVLVVAQMVLVNRVRWLEGAMLIALHVFVGCVCLLGGWHLCAGTERSKAQPSASL